MLIPLCRSEIEAAFRKFWRQRYCVGALSILTMMLSNSQLFFHELLLVIVTCIIQAYVMHGVISLLSWRVSLLEIMMLINIKHLQLIANCYCVVHVFLLIFYCAQVTIGDTHEVVINVMPVKRRFFV